MGYAELGWWLLRLGEVEDILGGLPGDHYDACDEEQLEEEDLRVEC